LFRPGKTIAKSTKSTQLDDARRSVGVFFHQDTNTDIERNKTTTNNPKYKIFKHLAIRLMRREAARGGRGGF
jgi:hypothetical protein